MKRYRDPLSIDVGHDGKVILGDAELERIERAFVPSAGGVENSTTCNGTNASCQNTGQCGDSDNTSSCQNTHCGTHEK